MVPNEIPPFGVSGALPPFVGSPANPGAMSPYRTTLTKLVERYGGTPRRKEILEGLLAYRRAILTAGLAAGFQWLDGSFLEDIERTEKRDPGDIDLVNFVRRPKALQTDDVAWGNFVHSNAHIFDPVRTKRAFSCDSYFVDLDLDSESVVDQTRYWFGLFSHKRRTFLWKGLIEVPLGEKADDSAASLFMERRGLR